MISVIPTSEGQRAQSRAGNPLVDGWFTTVHQISDDVYWVTDRLKA
jgi:hypothetical protein